MPGHNRTKFKFNWSEILFSGSNLSATILIAFKSLPFANYKRTQKKERNKKKEIEGKKRKWELRACKETVLSK